MSKYWECRTYKHQQGSLVWNRHPPDLYCLLWLFWMSDYPNFVKDEVSFRIDK